MNQLTNESPARPSAGMSLRSGLTAGRPLGDALAGVTQTTGLDGLAQAYTALTGLDCGCEARRQMLNRIFPYS